MYLTDNNYLVKLSSYLFLLIPIFLITGPFLSDLSLTLVSIFILIHLVNNKDYKYLNNRYVYFFLIFYFYIILNSLFNNFNLDSIRISVTFIRFGLFTIATIYILNYNKNLLKNLYQVYLLCFSILIIDGFYQFFMDYNIFGYPLKPGPRVSSFFNDELILGSYLCRSFPVFFGLMIYHYNKLSKKYYYYGCIIFILSEVLVYLSGERAAFFYMNLSSIFILIVIKDFKITRLAIFILSIFFIIILSISYPSSKQRIIDYSIKQMNINKGYSDIIVFSIQHNELYKSAIKIYQDNKIFGVGVKNFRNFCGKPKFKTSELSCDNHPHNTYIQILSELGLVGFVFILILLLYFLKYLFIHLKKLFFLKSYHFTDFEICLMSSFLITLWPIVPTGNFFNNWLSIISFYPLGIFFWSITNRISINSN